MIILHQFARSWGLPNLSHFCVKIETYMRMAEIPYRIVESLPLKAPKGKLPFIEDDGHKIADSNLILEHLKQRHGNTPDARLSASEKAIVTAMTRLIEDHLYWISMYTRWQYTEENWQQNKKAIFSVLPPVIRDIAAFLYRIRIRRQILGHGISRLEETDIFRLGRLDIDALADYLADRPYFFGDRPSSLDAIAYGFLCNIINCPIESPLKEYAHQKTNLVEYCRRIQQAYFADLAQ